MMVISKIHSKTSLYDYSLLSNIANTKFCTIALNVLQFYLSTAKLVMIIKNHRNIHLMSVLFVIHFSLYLWYFELIICIFPHTFTLWFLLYIFLQVHVNSHSYFCLTELITAIIVIIIILVIIIIRWDVPVGWENSS